MDQALPHASSAPRASVHALRQPWPRFDSLPYLRSFDPDHWTCWHVVLEFYRSALGIELPRYGVDEYPDVAIGRQFAEARQSGLWRSVDQPAFGDLLTFWEVHPAFDNHVAVIVAPRMMMHVQLGGSTSIARYDSPAWGDRRTGIFRHRDL